MYYTDIVQVWRIEVLKQTYYGSVSILFWKKTGKGKISIEEGRRNIEGMYQCLVYEVSSIACQTKKIGGCSVSITT